MMVKHSKSIKKIFLITTKDDVRINLIKFNIKNFSSIFENFRVRTMQTDKKSVWKR